MKSKPNGFSLIELLVVLIIVSILASIVAYGIGLIQRNTRNTERRKIVSDLMLQTNSIRASLINTPSNIDTTNSIGSCTINFYNGNELLSELFYIEEYTCAPNVSSTCSIDNFTGPEETVKQVTLCYSGSDMEVGIKLENSNTPYIMGL
jgi:prepilin-type N-terminal cleavage/methylation domain-containing protein